MKCVKCNAELPEGAKFCNMCGAKQETNSPKYCVQCGSALLNGAAFCSDCGASQNSQGAAQTPQPQQPVSPAYRAAQAPQSQQPVPPAQGIPVINGNEWFSFVRTGNYTLKYKLNTNLQILCGGREAALLARFNSETDGVYYYDLVQNENDRNAVVRFVRSDNIFSCVNPVTGDIYFSWQRQSSSLGELASGSKWQCGTLSLGQSGMRSLAQWIPNICWLIPTKYFIRDNGRDVGAVKGSSFSFSNSKSAEVLDPSRAWEILAVSIILSDDELG